MTGNKAKLNEGNMHVYRYLTLQQSISLGFALQDVLYTASANTGLRRSHLLEYREQLTLSYFVEHAKPRPKGSLNLLTNFLWPLLLHTASFLLSSRSKTGFRELHAPASRAQYTNVYIPFGHKML